MWVNTYTMKMLYFNICVLIFNVAIGQQFQIYQGDTINIVDANNLKQRHWIYFGSMKELPGYADNAKVEEGNYKDNRKTGEWTKYFPSGEIQNQITFSNNRPNGPYKIFYPSGQVQEEGVWKNNRNVGSFKRFHENGHIQQEFNFTSTGKRDGSQKYYHENGQLMIEGNWAGGKEAGEVVEYYANGEVKSKKYFNNGIIDEGKTKTFEPKTEVVEVKETTNKDVKIANVQKDVKPNLGYFNGTGEATLYNKNKQISQKGYFKNGRLINGKWYKYNSDGILQSVEIYKNGHYVGEGVIEDE